MYRCYARSYAAGYTFKLLPSSSYRIRKGQNMIVRHVCVNICLKQRRCLKFYVYCYLGLVLKSCASAANHKGAGGIKGFAIMRYINLLLTLTLTLYFRPVRLSACVRTCVPRRRHSAIGLSTWNSSHQYAYALAVCLNIRLILMPSTPVAISLLSYTLAVIISVENMQKWRRK